MFGMFVSNTVVRKSLLIFLLLLLPVLLHAQFYFGKNKVQYTRFNWHVMETEHFRIFFYLEEDAVAQIAARLAEDSYRTLSSRFKHEIYAKIPLIIYNSPNFFSQTNVIPILLPLAGFYNHLSEVSWNL